MTGVCVYVCENDNVCVRALARVYTCMFYLRFSADIVCYDGVRV